MQDYYKEVGYNGEKSSKEDNKIPGEENIIDLTESATSESESEVRSEEMEVDDLESAPNH